MSFRETRHRYDRIARIYDAMESPMEMLVLSEWRKELLSSVKGRVLEVGIGTGRNLVWYPPGITLVGIDISPNMLARAAERAAILRRGISLVEMDVEQMAFPDRCFDHVVSTCVFCSVPDPVRGLREIKRVLKESGSALFLEHVRSENPFMGMLMDMMNPLVHRLVGPHINRRTVENIKKADLEILSLEEGWLKIMKKIRVR